MIRYSCSSGSAQNDMSRLLAPTTAVKNSGFAPSSYGFRPGRGCKDALRRVTELLQRGYRWVVDADLKSYFDTIPH